jgi:PAS domain S-box-containing protein
MRPPLPPSCPSSIPTIASGRRPPSRLASILCRRHVQDEHRIVRPDGSVRWVLAKGQVTFAGEGAARKAKHGAGCVLDITERKLAETALVASEERYRTLVESATDIIATLDLDGRFISINPAVERILGYTPDELIGKKIDDFVRPAQMPMQDAMLRRKLEGEASTQYELEMLAKDGQRRMILDVKSRLALGDDGKPLAIHSIARDITERKEADARPCFCASCSTTRICWP